LASPPSPSPGAPDKPANANAIGVYLDSLAAAVPAPGGGSATGLAGALGAALVCMVANYTVGRPKYAAVEEEVRAALEEADALRVKLMELAEVDHKAYERVAAARKLPRSNEGERMLRSDEIQRATRAAAHPPLEMAEACRRALELSEVVAKDGNASLASDAGVAALFSEAALRASAINVRVNLAAVEDPIFVRALDEKLDALLEGSAALKEEILAIAGRRMVGG
jgi:formiminotetrahydrofolate cyclodeaminase